MILDQGTGAHHAQVEYLTFGWTWVSGESLAAATITGQWSNVITARANTGPINVTANTGPVTARAKTTVELNG